MQLFRQQAIDHQHRLYGEVLLVPPLRWSAIVALLLILVAATAAFLTWGRYSQTIVAGGTSLSADRVTLAVPASAMGRIAAGQPVRLLEEAPSGQDKRLFHGVIEHIDAVPANSAQPYVPVTARLTRRDQGSAPAFTPGMAIDARIVLPPRPLLQWFVSPHAGEATP